MADRNPFYENYYHLSTKALKLMLGYESTVGGDPARWTAIRAILAYPRFFKFRHGRDYIEKPL